MYRYMLMYVITGLATSVCWVMIRVGNVVLTYSDSGCRRRF